MTNTLFENLTLLLSRISTASYTKSLTVLNGGSVGEHVRHTLEFFTCLLNQVEDGCINYDLRPRNQELESDPSLALNQVNLICQSLAEMGADKPLVLETSGDENSNTRIRTSFRREMIYVHEHAVHHMALIKAGMSELPASIDLPDSFGVAPSTLRYREKNLQKM